MAIREALSRHAIIDFFKEKIKTIPMDPLEIKDIEDTSRLTAKV